MKRVGTGAIALRSLAAVWIAVVGAALAAAAHRTLLRGT